MRRRPVVCMDNPYYMVYPDGRIYSLISDCFVKPFLNTKGYLRVQLYGDNGRQWEFVSRLVAKAFIPLVGHKYEDMQVDHDDMNKENNHYKNLAWVTNKENQRRRWAKFRAGFSRVKNYTEEELKDIPF